MVSLWLPPFYHHIIFAMLGWNALANWSMLELTLVIL